MTRLYAFILLYVNHILQGVMLSHSNVVASVASITIHLVSDDEAKNYSITAVATFSLSLPFPFLSTLLMIMMMMDLLLLLFLICLLVVGCM